MLIDIMHTVTNALQGPVIVVLMALAVLMVVIVGMLVAEFFTERRYFKLSVPKLVDDLQSSSDPETVIRESGMLRRQKSALFELLAHPHATAAERESMAVNIVAQEQAIFDNRVKVTDFISKVGPMLGLMGTLIPLGPGVIAIGAGDTQTLSVSLLVAFDTTIMGLLVAALALLVSTIRKAWYAKYNAAFEAACEVVLEKANEGAALRDLTLVALGPAHEQACDQEHGEAHGEMHDQPATSISLHEDDSTSDIEQAHEMHGERNRQMMGVLSEGNGHD